MVCATSKASDQPVHIRSLIKAFASCLNILWLFSYWPNIILSFLSLKQGCTGSSECTPVKMPHCWKSCVTAHVCYFTKTSWVCQYVFIVSKSVSWVLLSKMFEILFFLPISFIKCFGCYKELSFWDCSFKYHNKSFGLHKKNDFQLHIHTFILWGGQWLSGRVLAYR